MDCEMVKTESDNSCLVSLSLVNDKGKPLFYALVKPREQVLDYRSGITGVTASDLEVRARI